LEVFDAPNPCFLVCAKTLSFKIKKKPNIKNQKTVANLKKWVTLFQKN
jgi:hypothetical protein